MTPISVLTLVKNRAAHLEQLAEGLRRSSLQPAELIVIDMSDDPVARPEAGFPVHVHRLQTTGLPLAQARNLAARVAVSPHLLFLDVDCIPLRDCVALMARTIERDDALVCADIRYLGPGDAAPGWDDAALLAGGRSHPVRSFPASGIKRESNPGLFWSLAFAIRRDRFFALDGFDEGFTGYGAEDTDFGFRADRAGLPLLFLGGAIACHQHHPVFDPPIQHLEDIVRNARIFRERWGWWPMAGWLEGFRRLGLLAWEDDAIDKRRDPTAADFAAVSTDI